jgi:amino acid transporter
VWSQQPAGTTILASPTSYLYLICSLPGQTVTSHSAQNLFSSPLQITTYSLVFLLALVYIFECYEKNKDKRIMGKKVSLGPKAILL